MSRNKRNFDQFDPNKSDSDDLDYDNSAAPRVRPQGRSQRSRGASSRKPAKRRRETYGDSSDDVERDSDDVSEEEDSFAESEEQEPVEVNPRTGRSVRSAAKKAITYEESEEDESDTPSSPRQSPPPKSAKRRGVREELPDEKAERPQLIVKFRLPPGTNMDSSGIRKSRASSRTLKQEPTTQATQTRRSSRISHDEQEALVALSDSAKHEVVTRAGTATPEPPGTRRPTRGSKGVKKPPSAILEASHEDSVIHSQPTQEDEEILAQLEAAAGAETETSEKQMSQASPAAEGASTMQDDNIQMEYVDEEEHIVQESQPDPEDQDEDEGPISRGGRALRVRRKESTPPTSQPAVSSRRSLRQKKSATEPSSDFEPDAEGDAEGEDDMSDDELLKIPPGASSNDDSSGGRRSGRLRGKARSQRSRSRRNRSDDEVDEELDVEEIADEAAELDEDRRRNRRPTRRTQQSDATISYEPKLRDRGKKPDYRIFRPEYLLNVEEEEGPAAHTPQRNRRGGGGNYFRSLFTTAGPFGGAGGPPAVLGGPEGTGAAGGVESDSSDDEAAAKGGQANLGGTAGMTPTSAFPKPYAPQALNNDPIQGPGGGPPGLGKVKDKKALADADPLGVDTNVTFDGVGGLDNHINQLKEMVALPLLYPEVFQRFHVTPPRGVLFHGPPGTGKTLLARALASSVSSHGRKVTFYMRKGADALSKWVGEAEKQLRLLFEEARKNQPSIIFFDEIDGLAPVRSSKQEQIHASIVATLLALMDGMDGRGQVIVIGATNRPDSVDPALRRPGRFDREFYFPLPDQLGRRKIIDIHTKGWEPPLQPAFKDQLAEITRGYGGADLRALCTEAALNAVQGTYPQIYSSDQKLIIDPSSIKVLAKDFMISVNKMIPSSERSAASGAAPLKKDIEPLLRQPLKEITTRLEEVIPRKRKATALEEAMYDDRDDEFGFEKETLQREFEASRIFRPRLLIEGREGMGQQYLGAALLSKFEGLHVQNFDLPTLMKDSTRSPEAAVVQLFEEVKRHKPSVIYIPNVNTWYETLSDSTIRTFAGLLRSLPPTDPVLLLGIMDVDAYEDGELRVHPDLMRLFGYSTKNRYRLERPSRDARKEFFGAILDLIRKTPQEFPDLEHRKKRKLPALPVAPAEAPRGPTEAELREQRKKDRLTLNQLRLHILQVMEQIKKYKKFRNPIVDESQISYLFDETDPMVLSTDLAEEERRQQQMHRPYEIDKDKTGHPGIREVATGKFYYNLEIITIEKRLANGYYKRPMDFTADFKRIAKDAKVSGDQDRTVRANELLATVEVDMAHLEQQFPALAAECEAVYQREVQRQTKQVEKAREAMRQGQEVPKIIANVPPAPIGSKTTSDNSGPIVLGQPVPGRPPVLPLTPTRFGPSPNSNQWSTTNGSHPSHHTNGSTIPSRPPQEDTELYENSQPEATGHTHAAGHPSQFTQAQAGQLSQRSALTHMAPGSQLEQYHNSASTTTSGQKTGHGSNRTSEQSNGIYPDFSMMGPGSGSQLPDTQPPSNGSQQSTQHQSAHQQHTMGPPRRESRTAPIAAILNNPSPDEGLDEDVDMSSPYQTLVLDPQILATFHEGLVEKSSGLSLEQLEQVNASMMDVFWKQRHDWNRVKVTEAVQIAFNDTIKDIEYCQEILHPSQEYKNHRRAAERRDTMN